jgi:hypothetical protein
LKFELVYSAKVNVQPRFIEIYQFVKPLSERLTKLFFHYFADILNEETDPRVFEFATSLTLEIFTTEMIGTRSVERFLSFALRNIDVDFIIAIYAVVCDLIDLGTIEGRHWAMRAALVIEVREDLREILIPDFPIQDVDVLVHSDMQYLADLISGKSNANMAIRTWNDRTSEDDSVDYNITSLFDPEPPSRSR